MKYIIRNRKVEQIAESKCTIGFLFDFYIRPENGRIILLIKRNENIVGYLNRTVACNCMEMNDINSALKESLGMCISEKDLTDLEKLNSLYDPKWGRLSENPE